MWGVKACRVCLSTNTKLCNMESYDLGRHYELLTGMKCHSGDGLPWNLCIECAAHVRRFVAFRDKCWRAYFTLTAILDRKNEITLNDVNAIDRKNSGIMPTLAHWTSDRHHYEEVIKSNRRQNKNHVEIFATEASSTEMINSTQTDHLSKEIIKIEIDDSSNEDKNEMTIVDSCDLELQPKLNVDMEVPIESYDVKDSDNFDSDFEPEENVASEITPVSKSENVVEAETEIADGSMTAKEYAIIIPISFKEQKAVVEVYKLASRGKNQCDICKKGYSTEDRLKVHMRMHEMHISGTFKCELCDYYYKTDYLLHTHMTEKHMYKYVCTKCPEVNYTRSVAKQHYLLCHMREIRTKEPRVRPSWMSARGGCRVKGITRKPKRKEQKYPEDYPIRSVVPQSEQYEVVNERKKSRNYIESVFKCEMCFKGFREEATFSNHQKKHDPLKSGKLQCDMCKIRVTNTRFMYKHMVSTHTVRYSCQMCEYVCYSRTQCRAHYKWHKNVTYKCEHCDKIFAKPSTRLTHIRIKHPSTYLCAACGHGFVSSHGLIFHRKKSHTKEEVEEGLRLQKKQPDPSNDLYCKDCSMWFLSADAYDRHLGSSIKHTMMNVSFQPPKRHIPKKFVKPNSQKRRRKGPTDILNSCTATASDCDECGKHLANDSQAIKHYRAEHPGVKYLQRYMCDICGHTTQQYGNLQVHMRTHTNEKPYTCPHCDKSFSMPSNRDRHLVVHTGEKRFECEFCHRRFTQNSGKRLHVQTVHMKIPYPPWNKTYRKRRKELQTADIQPVSPPEQKEISVAEPEYLNSYVSYTNM